MACRSGDPRLAFTSVMVLTTKRITMQQRMGSACGGDAAGVTSMHRSLRR